MLTASASRSQSPRDRDREDRKPDLPPPFPFASTSAPAADVDAARGGGGGGGVVVKGESADGETPSASGSGLRSGSGSGSGTPKEEEGEGGDDDDGEGIEKYLAEVKARSDKGKGKAKGSGRGSSRAAKVPDAEPQLIGHLPVANEEAGRTFVELEESTYTNKSIGDVKYHDADMARCDCVPDPSASGWNPLSLSPFRLSLGCVMPRADPLGRGASEQPCQKTSRRVASTRTASAASCSWSATGASAGAETSARTSGASSRCCSSSFSASIRSECRLLTFHLFAFAHPASRSANTRRSRLSRRRRRALAFGPRPTSLRESAADPLLPRGVSRTSQSN